MKYFEYIHVFCKKTPQYNPQFFESKPMNTVNHGGSVQSDNYGRYSKIENKRRNTTQRYPSDILRFNTVNNQSKDKYHPTQKPVALLEYLIRTYTNESETVLDFTAGSMSTAIACINTNRKGIMIEKDEHYFKVGSDRVAQALQERGNNNI